MTSIVSVGVGLSFVAMLAWGIGDFLIQKSSRRLGDWETLFVVTLFITIILVPFEWRALPGLLSQSKDLYILLGSAIFLTVAAIFEIESFKRGKMSVVEPMLPFEIPAAAILAAVILGDKVTGAQAALVASLIIGLVLVSFTGRIFSMRYFLEKGVILGLTGAAFMGVADFLLGWGSRATDPLLATFVQNGVMMIISLAVLAASGGGRKLIRDVKANSGLVLMMSIADNVGWVGYAFAMSIVPIAVATGLSESSCIIAVLLGIFVNREKLQRHQKTGLVLAICSAIALAFVTAS
ncbi:MAG: DMT family transporter [Patescibacteria group bacterium]|nr:DMT family transporter [Patescibacteria group bacterium]MDE1940707.1 DMT family transporter [Patescibacteria group bacterium]MDE1966959.1 DMT family transporter [Patescibacteria group bacterium]